MIARFVPLASWLKYLPRTAVLDFAADFAGAGLDVRVFIEFPFAKCRTARADEANDAIHLIMTDEQHFASGGYADGEKSEVGGGVCGVKVRVGAYIAFEDGDGFVEGDAVLAEVRRGFARVVFVVSWHVLHFSTVRAFDGIPVRRCGKHAGKLLDCHALGEVSRLVYVAASSYGYVVGEELEGDDLEDGGRSSWEAWGLDDVSALAIGTARLFQKIARGRGIRMDEVRQRAGRPPGNRRNVLIYQICLLMT